MNLKQKKILKQKKLYQENNNKIEHRPQERIPAYVIPYYQLTYRDKVGYNLIQNAKTEKSNEH